MVCRCALGGTEDAWDIDYGEIILLGAADLDLKNIIGEDGAGSGRIVDIDTDAELDIDLVAFSLHVLHRIGGMAYLIQNTGQIVADFIGP